MPGPIFWVLSPRISVRIGRANDDIGIMTGSPADFTFGSYGLNAASVVTVE